MNEGHLEVILSELAIVQDHEKSTEKKGRCQIHEGLEKN
jgi:hypothetical protein